MSRRKEKTGGAGITGKLPRGLRGLARMATLNTRVDNIVGNLGTIRSRLDNSAQRLVTLAEQARQQNEQVRRQNERLADTTQELESLAEQVQRQNERLADTTQELEMLCTRLGVLESQVLQLCGTDFEELQKNWDELGKRDALWAILSHPEKGNGKWNVSEFFESGEREIADVLEYISSLDVPLSRGRALDFGCGVGRLTQALCQHFDECHGVDIAPSMIQIAEEYNSFGNRCLYHVNASGDLRLFRDKTFDFIYSNIVLQHMKPKYSKRYMREFLRVLAPDGVLVFHIPSELERVGEVLPDSGFRATISPHVSSITVEAGSQTTVRATVKNVSDSTWHSLGADFNGKHQIKLGNYWLDDSGNRVADDGRTNLPHDLEPTEEIDLDLLISAPPEPGDYVVELDMVQEMVAWFKDKGSEAAKIDVRTNGKQPVARSGRLVPKIEMYGVPEQEILDLLASCGGEIVDVRKVFDVGLDLDALENSVSAWRNLRYCVTKVPEGERSVPKSLESVEL